MGQVVRALGVGGDLGGEEVVEEDESLLDILRVGLSGTMFEGERKGFVEKSLEFMQSLLQN